MKGVNRTVNCSWPTLKSQSIHFNRGKQSIQLGGLQIKKNTDARESTVEKEAICPIPQNRPRGGNYPTAL